MQRIERYGVIALVFLLVTIVAVSLWGEQKKAGGLLTFLKRESQSSRVDRLVADARSQPTTPASGLPVRELNDRILPLGAQDEPSTAPIATAPAPDPRQPTVGREGELLGGPEPDVAGSSYRPEQVPTDLRSVRDQPRLEPLPRMESFHAEPPAPRTYAIRAGDTLSEISLRELGTSKRWSEIVALNAGLDPARLMVGQTIQLPPQSAGSVQVAATGIGSQPASQPAMAPQPRTEDAPSTPRSYSIRAGDTLSEIASRELGSSKRWREIEALNAGLDPTKLWVGKTIQLPPQSGGPVQVAAAGVESRPAARSATPLEPGPEDAPPTARSYSVRAGDTLGEIASRELGSSRRWTEIVALNQGVDPERLLVGQRLRLPAADVGNPSTRLAAASPTRSSASRGSKVR